MTKKGLCTHVVFIAVIAAVLVAVAPAAYAQGPVILMGIDAEDGGVGGHGPITVYETVVQTGLYNQATGGSGILVIGGGKLGDLSNPCGVAFDNVTDFWDRVSVDTGLSVTYVFGAANISAVSFSSFRMIAVVSDEFNTFCGGLTAAENTALSGRQADIATYVNSGHGLLGFSSDFGPQSYAYMAGVGSFIVDTNQFYADITPTPAGTAVGISDDLDICCWHDTYKTFPSFLQVLAIANDPNDPLSLGETAAIGGAKVVIPVGITLDPPSASNPAVVGTPHTVTATVKDQNGTPQPGVTVTFAVVSGPNAGFDSTNTPTCNPPMCQTDAFGQVSWTYFSNGQAGTDTIEACFTDAQGVKKCAKATKEWVAPASLPGRMNGGGTIAGSTVRHGFRLLCNPLGVPQRLEVNWDGNRFHLESLLTARCSDGPSISEEQPVAGFDTYEGTGSGRCNNQPASISWKFTDAGEPGDNDTAKIDIMGVACSLSVSGKLKMGNHQALPE